MRVPKKKKSERLCDWLNRLMEEVPIRRLDDEDMAELLREISVKSYIEGSNTAQEILNNVRNRNHEQQDY